jgi:hypothetical protein
VSALPPHDDQADRAAAEAVRRAADYLMLDSAAMATTPFPQVKDGSRYPTVQVTALLVTLHSVFLSLPFNTRDIA